MANKTNNIQKHYLDYYSDWSLALLSARTYLDMKDVHIKGSAFIGIINELWDAGMIPVELLNSYTTEVNKLTARKLQTYLN